MMLSLSLTVIALTYSKSKYTSKSTLMEMDSLICHKIVKNLSDFVTHTDTHTHERKICKAKPNNARDCPKCP